MKKKIILSCAFALSFISTQAQIGWSGATNPVTTESNVTIGVNNTGSATYTPTYKIIVREDNPFIELIDATPYQPAGSLAAFASSGVKLTANTTSYEVKNWQPGSAYPNTFSILKTGNLFGYHMIGSNIWMGGCGGLAPASLGTIKMAADVEFMGFTKMPQLAIDVNCVPSGYKLAVNGKIICTELKVMVKPSPDCLGWGDFVFKPEYKLLPSNELRNYIDQNQHLPGIPTAEEIHENGFEVGEMQRLQMIKLEELYLYMFQLKDQNELLIQQNQHLQEEIDLLKAKVNQ